MALANEVKSFGITVSVLCPGPTKTGFFSRANFPGNSYLEKMKMDPDKVAIAGYRGLMAGKEIIVPGFSNKFQVFLLRFLPKKLAAKAARRFVENGRL